MNALLQRLAVAGAGAALLAARQCFRVVYLFL